MRPRELRIFNVKLAVSHTGHSMQDFNLLVLMLLKLILF